MVGEAEIVEIGDKAEVTDMRPGAALPLDCEDMRRVTAMVGISSSSLLLESNVLLLANTLTSGRTTVDVRAMATILAPVTPATCS